MHESSIPGTIGGKSGHRDKQTKPGTIQGNPGRLASMQVVQRSSDDAAIGACPEDLGRVHANLLVAELAMKIDTNVSTCGYREEGCHREL